MAKIPPYEFTGRNWSTPEPSGFIPFSAKLRELHHILNASETLEHVTVRTSVKIDGSELMSELTVLARPYESDESYRRYVHTELETQLTRALMRKVNPQTRIYAAGVI